MNYKDVGIFLENRARRLGGDAPIFYGDLAAHFGLPPVTEAWSAHPLSAMFEQLDQEDARTSRPFRTALVISRERNMPGEGFFKTFVRLRSPMPVPRTEQNKMKLFLEELNSLLIHYAQAGRES